MEVTEEYEFYTPFKMLFISLSLGALSTSNFTHSYNSPPNSSCFSSGFLRVILVYVLSGAAHAVAGDSYTPVNFPNTPSPKGAHTHTRSVSEWQALGTA